MQRYILIAVVAAMLAGTALAKDRKPPKLRHDPISKAQKGQAIEVQVSITDRSGVFDPTLYYRTTGSTDYLRATLVKSTEKYVATIPAAAANGDVEYFVEAYDELGNGPARVGSPDKPLVIKLKNAPPETNPNDPKGDGDQDPGTVDPTTGTGDPVAGDDGEEDDGMVWAIAAGAGGAVVVAAVVTAIILWLMTQEDEPPGTVTLEVSGPSPTK